MGIRQSGGPRGPLRAAVQTAATAAVPYTRMVVSDGRLRYLTGGPRRPWEPGLELAVKDIGSADGIVNSVGEMARNRLHEIPVLHVGGLINAQALGVADPGNFFAEGVRALFNHAAALGLTPLETMQFVCGKDTFGSANKMISRGERVRRMLEGQLAAVAEMQVHAPGYQYDVIYNPRMLPTMLEYTYAFVNRSGYEHGIRFELRQTHVLENLPFLTGLRPLHQYRAPQIIGNAFAASSDSLLFGNLAISVQYKAFSTLDAIARGGVRFTTSGGIVTGVDGKTLLSQVVTDGLRAKRRGFRVPNGNAAPWTQIAAPSAGTANWHNLSNQTLGIVDSSHLMNQVIELVDKAFVDYPTLRVINPMVHIRVAQYRQRMIRDILGSSIPRDADELAQRGAVEAYLERELPILENLANTELAKPHVVGNIGRALSLRLIASHQATQLIAFLEANGVVPVGVLTEEML